MGASLRDTWPAAAATLIAAPGQTIWTEMNPFSLAKQCQCDCWSALFQLPFFKVSLNTWETILLLWMDPSGEISG